MAKKGKVTAADFLNPKAGSWADEIRSSYQQRLASRRDEERSRPDRLEGILEALRAEGASDAVLEEVSRQFLETGEFDVPETTAVAEPEAAPVLPEADASPYGFDTESLPQMQAIPAQSMFDSLSTSASQLASDAGARLRAGARENLAGLITAPADLLNAAIQSPANLQVATKLGIKLPTFRNFDVINEEANRLHEEAARIREQELSARSRVGDDVIGEAEGFFGTLEAVVRNPTILLDQAAQTAGQMVPGFVGGPAGPTGAVLTQAAGAAGQQAREARETVKAQGGTDAEAEAAANIAALSSFAVNTAIPAAIPGGQALETLVSRGVGQAAGRSAVRAAAVPLAGEAAEEGVSEALEQVGMNLATGRPLTEDVSKNAALGTVLGVGAGAAPAGVNYTQANRARRARIEDNERDILEGAARVQDSVSEPVLPTSEPVREPEQGDLFGVPEDAPSFEEQDAARQRQLEEDVAWAQRNRERDEQEQQARREELRNSYVARVDSARQEVESLQDRIEAGDTDSATLNAASRAQRDLMEAENNLRSLDEAFASREEATQVLTEEAPVQETEPVQRDFVQEQQEQERVRQINDVARRREAISKKAAEQAAKDEKKADTASRALRNKAIDSLFAEGLSDAEVVDQLPARIAQMRQEEAANKAEAEDATLKKIKAIRNSIEGQRKKKLGESSRKRLEALVKRNPNSTPQQIKAMFEAATPEAQAPTTDANISSSDIAKLKQSDDPYDRIQAEALERLGMAAPSQEAAPNYREQVKRIARNLGNSADGRAAAVEKLIKQGKVVILPNATALGRENVARAGEYDTSTGTTYLYTDYLNDGNLADVLEAAAHESTHLGQFNGRDARSEKLRSLLGDKGVQEGARKLRAAAAKGNKLAQEALEAAQADTAARGGDSRYEDLELVAYAVGTENRARTGTLGSAAGAIRDLVSSAKDQLRSKLGINLDVSVNDLRSAMGKVLDEAVETEPVLRATPEVLGMIYNVRPDNPTQGQIEAIEAGNVYDSVDGTQKFVLSDADSFVDRAKLSELANAPDGTAMRLGDLLEHDVLYRERPGAADVEIRVSDDLGPTVRGRYYPLSKRIEVNRNILKQEDPYQPTAREIILHEVQHYVQDVDGRSSQYHDSPYAASKIRKAATAMDRAKTAYELASTSVVQNAVRYTNGPGKGLVRRIVEREGIDDTVKARMIRDLFANQQYMSAQLRPLLEDLNATRDKYNATIREYNDAIRQAHADYMANITEREAHFTQYNMDASQRELDAQGNPEDVMRTQEQDLDDGTDITGGRIDVPQSDGTVSAMSQEASTGRRRRSEVLDILDNSTFYRGSRTEGDIPSVSDGALGPGHYLTSDRAAAEGYGPNVGEWQVDVASPLIVEMADVEKFEGNTARALVENERFWKENFNTKGGAVRWANEQWDDWAGIGDPDFTSMLRDAGFDSVALMNGRDVVELNVPSRSQIVPPSDTTLGMAARTSKGGAFRNKNKVTTFLTAAIRNDKGLGKHIRNEVELAKAAPVEFESKANRAAGQYDAAINKLAQQRGVTPEALNAEIRDKLEEIADMPGSASEYRAAFNKIADQYGDAGKALKRLRGLVDDLSAEFIRTYLDSGAKLTNKEKEDVKKVAANLGRYVHRFYASRLGGRVRGVYSKAVQDAVDKARKKGVGSLTPKQKELHDRYVRAAKAILEGVKIPDAESIGELLDSQVDYLYDTWFGTDQTGMTREEKESALLQRREEIGPEDLDNKVEAAAHALLWGAEANAATRYYDRGEKLDTTIMQKRSRIPKEIRELMGEITDPAGALLTTVSKQAEYVARTKMLFALRDLASPEDLQPPGSAGNRAVRENNMTELTGDAYGPLRGYYASPALRAMIQDTSESLMNFTEAAVTNSRNGDAVWENAGRAVARAWMKGAAGAKAYNILGNVFRYSLNFLGSFAMLGINGNLNVKSWGRGLSDAIDIIRYAHSPSSGLGGAVLVSKYIVVDSATVGDLKLLDLGKIEQVVREMSGKSPGEFMRVARQLGMAGRELYAMMDVWSKIANFHAEADFLRALYKAEGLTKTDDEIYREASDIVNNTNMSYSRTAPFIKMLERGGITQYAPYLYEAHRVIFANLLQSAKEARDAANMSNPKAAAMLAARSLARFTGTTSTLAAIGYASHVLAGMWGDDEEDKRALLPEYARVMDFVNVGKDEEGRPVLYAISNLDPLGPATDLYRAARTSDRPMEALWSQFKENYIAPSLYGAVRDAFARTTGLVEPLTSRPRKPLLQQWSPDGWSAVVGVTGREDALASIVSAVETRYLPGTARAWSDSNPKAVGTDLDSVAWNISRAMGARGVRYDPEVGAKDAFFKYDDTMKEARRALASYIENTTNPSAEEITKRLLALRQDERQAWDQIARTYRGMVAIGMDRAEAYAKLKEAGVPKEVLRQIENEEFSSRVVSKQSLKNAAKLQIGKAKTQADKEKLEEKWNTAMEILSEVEGD